MRLDIPISCYKKQYSECITNLKIFDHLPVMFTEHSAHSHSVCWLHEHIYIMKAKDAVDKHTLNRMVDTLVEIIAYEAAMQEKVNDVKEQIVDVVGDVGKLKRNVDDLGEFVDSLRDGMDEMNTTITDSLNDIQAEMEKHGNNLLYIFTKFSHDVMDNLLYIFTNFSYDVMDICNRLKKKIIEYIEWIWGCMLIGTIGIWCIMYIPWKWMVIVLITLCIHFIVFDFLITLGTCTCLIILVLTATYRYHNEDVLFKINCNDLAALKLLSHKNN
jgi:hypothetical protein